MADECDKEELKVIPEQKGVGVMYIMLVIGFYYKSNGKPLVGFEPF